MAKKSSGKRRESSSLEYLHGYSRGEQDRLYRQARFLEDSVYKHVDLSKQSHIIEVGCGVGAQTEILLERFPKAKITSVDRSEKQLERARKHLSRQAKAGRVKLVEADALELPFADNSFDGAFLCWFLEHVQLPVEILREVHRVLKPGGVIYCSEVMNATFHVHPYSPATLKYWFEYNDHLWSLKGDPFVGGKLANYLLAAGYQNITTEVMVDHYDNRTPKKRSGWIEDWTGVLLSGAPALLAEKRVTPELIEEMKREMKKLNKDPNSVVFSSFVQARAVAL